MGPFEVPRADNTHPAPPGVVNGEVQLCRTMKLSNPDPLFVNRIQVAMNQGSHHMIIFRSNLDFPDQWFPCWGTVNFDDWDFVLDVNKTGGVDWPLAEGQAFMMKPHQQIMIQAHFVNATTVQAPLGGMVTINMYTTPQQNVQHVLRGLFTVNTAINIPPHSAYTTPPRNCTFSRSVALVAMTGHFHARGTLFDVHSVSSPIHMDGIVEHIDHGQIYQSTTWDAPPFQLFTPPPSMYGTLAFGDGVAFQCSYFNTTDNWIGWGGHADVQEHCNLFMQYYDLVDTSLDPPALTCRQGSGGW